MPDQTRKTPLVIFGFDAGDAPLMEKWMADGSLPTLKSIMQGGSRGRLAGPEMISEHGMWVTLTSGVSRSEHGYYYHRQLVPGSYALAPVSGQRVKAEPFWQKLPADMKVAVIDVPDIAAPLEHAGFEISEWATHYPYHPATTQPPELLSEIHEIFGPQLIIDEELSPDENRDRELHTLMTERIAKKGELCRQLLKRDDYELIFIVFTESHTGGHQFWKYHQAAEHDETGENNDPGLSIRSLYQSIDSEIGKIMELLPKEANVFAISSVGMKSQFPASGFNESICQNLGYQLPAPADPVDNAGGGLMPLLRRLIPGPIKDRLNRLVPRETQELWISDKFVSATDWENTEAFYIPSYYTGFVRVNLKGREPNGNVEPGAQYHSVINRIKAEFESLRDPVSGQAAVLEVALTVDLFGGEPPQTLPDIFIEWAETDRFVEQLTHPKFELQQQTCEFHRGSDHSRFGFFGGSGPDIASLGDIGEIDPLDLAPTFLALLGITDVSDLQGRPIMLRETK